MNAEYRNKNPLVLTRVGHVCKLLQPFDCQLNAASYATDLPTVGDFHNSGNWCPT